MKGGSSLFFVIASVQLLLLLCFLTSSTHGMFNNPITPANENTTCNSTNSCAGSDDACSPTITCDSLKGDCCALGLVCVNATCQSDNIGKWCDQPTDCFTDYVHVETACLNNTCILRYAPADDCDVNDDCLTNNCTTDGVCYGYALGDKCTNYAASQTSDCSYGLYCDGHCRQSAGVGGVCTSTVTCDFGLVCFSGKCIESFSLASDAQCSSVYQCQEDLVCYKGKCVQGAEYKAESCDSTDDCGTSEACFCSSFTGEKTCLPLNNNGNLVNLMNVTNSNADTAALYSCVFASNCTHFSNAPEACSEKNCGTEYKDSQSTNCDILDQEYGSSCVVAPLCGGFPVWAIIVIVIVGLIVLIALIVVLVMCCRKKKTDYESI